MGSQHAWVLPGAFLFAVGLNGCVHPSQPSTAVYSSIVTSEETTDASGAEVALRIEGSEASGLLVVCEGACYGSRWVGRIEGSILTFVVRHPRAEPGDPPEEYRLRISADDARAEQPAWMRGAPLRKVRRPAPGQTARWADYH